MLKISGPDVYFNATPPILDVYLFNPIPMTKVTVPESFGDDSATVFVLEGRLPEESPESESEFPAVTFVDDKGRAFSHSSRDSIIIVESLKFSPLNCNPLIGSKRERGRTEMRRD